MTALISSRRMPAWVLYTALLSVMYSCATDDGEAVLSFTGQISGQSLFGGSGEDTAREVISTLDGGFAVLGFSNSVDGDLQGKKFPVNDYWLLKLDPDGKREWSRTIGGSGDDRGQSLVQTRDGGFALVGYAMSADGDGSANQGFHDNWVVRLDSRGEILWERSFGYSGHDHAYDILETEDGGLLFVGFLDVTASGGEGNFGKDYAMTAHGVGEFWVTRLDSAGDLVWRRYYGGSNNDRAYAVTTAPDGGFLVVGATESTDFDIGASRGSYDYWVLRLDGDGELLWERSFGGSGIDRAFDVCRSTDGNYLIAGNTLSTDGQVSSLHGGSDIWVIKIDDRGELLWENTYGGSEFEGVESIGPDRSGGYLITGNSRSTDGDLKTNEGENDLWMFRIDGSGRLLWQESAGGSDFDFGFGAARNEAGRVLVAGETRGLPTTDVNFRGATDMWILLLD